MPSSGRHDRGTDPGDGDRAPPRRPRAPGPRHPPADPRPRELPEPAVLFFLMIRRPPRSTPLPYTTLFRSVVDLRAARLEVREGALHGGAEADEAGLGPRSEEHTSELQSRSALVCRLLL